MPYSHSNSEIFIHFSSIFFSEMNAFKQLEVYKTVVLFYFGIVLRF